MKRSDRHDMFSSLRGHRFSSSMKKRNKQGWAEDVFHLDSAQGKHKPLPGTAAHTDSSISSQKVFLIIGLFLVAFTIALFRVAQLQIFGETTYREIAQSNSQRIIPIPAERGLLYDRNGVQLTKNIPKFSLTLVPQDLPRDRGDRGEVVKRLAELTGQEQEEIAAVIDEFGSYSYESIVIEEDIDYETALAIQIKASDLPGIGIQRGSKRLYFHGGTEATTTEAYVPLSLSHVLGYQGKLSREELDALYEQGYLPSDDIGKTGVEKAYEPVLRGQYGRRRIEVNATGREQSVLAEEEPLPGHHVELTIDAEIQSLLEETLAEHLDPLETNKAAGVVLDASTGEVLAMVSLPSFDNNHFSGGIDTATYKSYIEDTARPLFHRAVGGTYPSGSTIKPAVAAIALQEGVVTPNTTFLSNGGVRVGDWFFPDWQSGGHGRTNVTRAIAWSVNTYFYYVGGGHDNFEGLGVDRMNAWLPRFGLSERLGVDLPGEAKGFIPSREWKQEAKGERWYIGDTYNMSIGQGDVLVTPLQIAAMTASIANGGALYRPHVVRSIIDPVSGDKRVVDSEKIRDGIISDGHLGTVRQGMRECVTYGSCRRLSLLPFEAAGKTGTAQWSSKSEDHAWFTSFAPYSNPEIVVTIMVEEGGGGAAVAAPIAHEFYQKWWNYITSA